MSEAISLHANPLPIVARWRLKDGTRFWLTRDGVLLRVALDGKVADVVAESMTSAKAKAVVASHGPGQRIVAIGNCGEETPIGGSTATCHDCGRATKGGRSRCYRCSVRRNRTRPRSAKGEESQLLCTEAREVIIGPRIAAYRRWVERYPGKSIDYPLARREWYAEQGLTPPVDDEDEEEKNHGRSVG